MAKRGGRGYLGVGGGRGTGGHTSIVQSNVPPHPLDFCLRKNFPTLNVSAANLKGLAAEAAFMEIGIPYPFR